MKGSREYKRIIAKVRKRNARKFGIRNGGMRVWIDDPRLERLFYNTKRKVTRPTVAALAALAALLVTACATSPEPRIVTRTVEIPVAVKCAVEIGPEPQFSDSPEALRSAADIWEKVKLLLAGRAQRDARLSELRASTAGCR